MSLPLLLRMPWHATLPAPRWLAALLLPGSLLGALAIIVFADAADGWQGAAVCYGLGLFFVWMFFFPGILLQALDAKHLRLPRAQRQSELSLLLYALLTVIPAALALTALGAPWAPTAVLLALCAIGGMSCALLPRYIAAFFCLVPAMVQPLLRLYPGVSTVTLVPLGTISCVALLAFIGLRWHQLMQRGELATGWSQPLVGQLRHGGWGHWRSIGDTGKLRQRADWLRQAADLTRTDPHHLNRTLRVALGGWYLPQTAGSYARQLLPLAWMLPAIVLIVIADTRVDLGSDVVKGFLVGMIGSLIGTAGPLVALSTWRWIDRRWQRLNAELPLLALLPQLGPRAVLKATLLRASLGLPLIIHGVLTGLVIVVMGLKPAYAGTLSLLLLAQGGHALLTVTLVLAVVSRRPLTVWQALGLLGLSLLLGLLSYVLPVLAWNGLPAAVGTLPIALLASAWLLLLGGLARLARNRWLALQTLAQPFISL